MTKLFTQNKKIKDSNSENYIVVNFGIPAYQADDGFKTCPMAGTCKIGCYAQQGAYVWSNVKPAYEYRLQQTKLPENEFIEVFSKELKSWNNKAMKQGKQLVVRIHDSGDFYSLDYALKWFKVMELFDDVIFYAYTKMIPMFKLFQKRNPVPSNFRLIYSFGGLADDKIDVNKDFHSQVFSSLDELQAYGYSDCTKNDLVAGLGDNHKIGLVYHGAKSKSWNTNKKLA